MKVQIALVLSALVLCDLGHAAEKAKMFFQQERSFKYDIFNNPATCEEARRHGMFNCFQLVRFLPDGQAWIMVTDIMGLASYHIVDDKVILESQSRSDVPKKLVFMLSENEKFLIQEGTRKVWEPSR